MAPAPSLPLRHVAALVGATLTLGVLAAVVGPGEAEAALTGGPQQVFTDRTPINFSGPLERGDRLPRGHVVVKRVGRMAPTDRPDFLTMTCPGVRGVVNFIVAEESELGVRNIDTAQYRRMAKRFRIEVQPAPPQFVEGNVASGGFYLLCGPRRSR